MLPLQVIDSFLLDYNVGQALLLAFLVTTLGALPLRSQKLIALNSILFGAVFLMTPQDLVPIHYMFLGIALLVAGPLLFATAND